MPADELGPLLDAGSDDVMAPEPEPEDFAAQVVLLGGEILG